jgi:tripartite-type tricarboxylate transporter receptor subunit TctC
VIVENRPGADGVLAAQATSSARPDGYTLLMGTNTAMVAAPTMRPTPPYDPFKAFTPISSAGQFSMFLVVPSSLPAKSVGELLALVAAKPGALNSASSNSASELAMLQLLGERKVVNARYKGDMQAMTDLLGGQIHMMFTTGTLAPGFVKEGRIRALVALLPQRSALLPDVPTGGELGLGKLTITPWAGFFGPPGLPQAITDRLSLELQNTLERPDVREQLVPAGLRGLRHEPGEVRRVLPCAVRRLRRDGAGAQREVRIAAASRRQKAASGKVPVPTPAAALSAMCSARLVPGIVQVTAGWLSTNFSSTCAQLVQPISPAQAGSGLSRRRRSRPPPPKGMLTITATPRSAASGSRRCSASRASSE